MDEERSPFHEALEGVGVALALLFTLFLLAFVVFNTWADWGPNGPTSAWTSTPMLLLSFFGMTQSVYILPAYLFFRRKGLRHTARGLLWGAGLILVVNLAAYFWWTRG
jgi:hypothetical protein